MWVHRYSEIRTLQVGHLLSKWLAGGEESKAIREKLEEKIDSYGQGKLDHAVDAVLCIWDISNQEEEPAASNLSGSALRLSRTISSAIPMFTGCDMQPALVKSIKEGHLLDRKYWTKRSRRGIEPIYFSSAVISSEILGFDTCESPLYGDALVLSCTVVGRHLGSEGRLETEDEDEYTEDSDYENDSEPADQQVSKNSEVSSENEGQQKLLSVLRTGSSAA